MNPRRRLVVNLIAVLVLGAVMVAWVATQLIGPQVVDRPFTVIADFASSGGVFTNQEVTYRGVLVGRVGNLELTEDGVAIELEVAPEWEGRIPGDVVASVNSKSAVGEQYVDLMPGSAGGPYLEEGSRIARDDTTLPVEIQDLFDSLENVLADVPPERTARVIRNLATGVGGKQGEIATILEALGRLARTFADVAPEQQRLLENATAAGSAFLRTKDEFARALAAADQVFGGLGDEPEELGDLFEQNDRLARSGIALLARRGDDLAAGIRGLADFTNYQLREREVLKQTLKHLPGFLHAIEDSAVPWEDPDGDRYYRIRVGVVADDVERTWPCKYRLPEDYERHYFVRESRRPRTDARCEPASEATDRAFARSLVAALEDWAADHPDEYAALQQPDVSDLPVSAEGFIWPLPGPITSYFGPRWGRMHTGIDIDGSMGDPVVAAASGRVVMAGYYSGYGNAVVVDHGGGVGTLYGHLASLSVGVGDDVERGRLIGAVGCTGSCTGDHLHFEVRVDGLPVDPLLYLPGGSLFVGGSVSDQPPEEEGFSDRPDPVESPAPSSSPDQNAIAPAPAPTSEATR